MRKGVFATRSPVRPNSLVLCAWRRESVEFHRELGPVLHFSGADLIDGTPICDIKPYILTDSHPEASGGFTEQIRDHRLMVVFPDKWLSLVPEEKREPLTEVLANDPRPGYQADPERVYGLAYGGMDVHFRVEGDVLTVCGVSGDQREQKENGTDLP